MQGKTHLVVGVAIGLAVADLSAPRSALLCGVVGGLAALVPDWLQINLPGVKQIQGVFGHRGFSHWLWTALISTFVLGGLSNAPSSVSVAFLAGWVSHILLDALSNGVPMFWPFGRLTIAHIKTGSRLDTMTGAAVLVLAGAMLIARAGMTILQSML